MKRRSTILSAILLGCMIMSESTQAKTLVDNFSDGALTITSVGERVKIEQPGLDSEVVIGGVRTVDFDGPDGHSLVVDTENQRLDFPDGLTDFANLFYGSVESRLGVDLAADGSEYFDFQFEGLSRDALSTFDRLHIEYSFQGDGTQGGGAQGVDLKDGLFPKTGENELRILIPFSDFDPRLTTSPDVFVVNTMALILSHLQPSVPFSITEISTFAVPEPNSFVLALSSFLSVTFCRRRH